MRWTHELNSSMSWTQLTSELNSLSQLTELISIHELFYLLVHIRTETKLLCWYRYRIGTYTKSLYWYRYWVGTDIKLLYWYRYRIGTDTKLLCWYRYRVGTDTKSLCWYRYRVGTDTNLLCWYLVPIPSWYVFQVICWYRYRVGMYTKSFCWYTDTELVLIPNYSVGTYRVSMDNYSSRFVGTDTKSCNSQLGTGTNRVIWYPYRLGIGNVPTKWLGIRTNSASDQQTIWYPYQLVSITNNSLSIRPTNQQSDLASIKTRYSFQQNVVSVPTCWYQYQVISTVGSDLVRIPTICIETIIIYSYQQLIRIKCCESASKALFHHFFAALRA